MRNGVFSSLTMDGPTRTDAPPVWDGGDDGSPIGLRIGGFLVEGRIAAAPGAGEHHRPYVVIGDEWAWKAYRIRPLRTAGLLERVRREAEVALSVDAVDGVVGAASADETEDWLVIRMRSMRCTLADHLAEREAEATPRLAADAYATLVADVGATLSRLHRRGIVHRDVKPANLLFDATLERLFVCDFSIVKTRGSELTGAGSPLGTDSYIAPEQWRSGECTPASDQYSLGIVAREVFSGSGAPALPRPLADVLRSACAVDPDDRYPGVSGARDFGEALVRAVETEAPATLADRMRNASPGTRYVWAPTLVAFSGYWLNNVLKRDPDIVIPLETLVTPTLFAGAAFAVLRLINAPRAKRSRSGWKLLDQWWLPWLAVLVLYLTGKGGIHGTEFLVLLLVPITFAILGAYPPRTGYWLPALLDRGARFGARNQWSRGWRPRLAVGAAVAALFTLIPSWVGHAWPAPWNGATGLDSAALRAVATHRQALLHGDLTAACAVVDKALQGRTPCPRWTELDSIASRNIQSQATRTQQDHLFDDTPLERIELRPIKGGANGDRIYTLSVHSPNLAAKRRGFGVLIVRRGGDVLVGITFGPAVTLDEFWRGRQHRYRVRQLNGLSRLQASQICTGSQKGVEGLTGGHCERAYEIAPAKLTSLIAKGRATGATSVKPPSAG